MTYIIVPYENFFADSTIVHIYKSIPVPKHIVPAAFFAGIHPTSPLIASFGAKRCTPRKYLMLLF